MKSTQCAAGRAVHRLVCNRCGFVAQSGQAAWSNITSITRRADGPAPQSGAHEVGLDMCRDCVRAILRSVLCLAPPLQPDPQPLRLRTMAEVDDYIATSNARLAAQREADRVELVTRAVPERSRSAA